MSNMEHKTTSATLANAGLDRLEAARAWAGKASSEADKLDPGVSDEARQRKIMSGKAKRDGRQRARELEKYTKSLSPVVNSVARFGVSAVVALQGPNMQASVRSFEAGLETNIKRRGGNILWLPADGNIQGEPLEEGDAQATLGAISQIRRDGKGLHVVAFRGTRFGAKNEGGTEDVVVRVQELKEQQRKLQREYFWTVQHGLGFLAIGSGEPRDLPAHPHYKYLKAFNSGQSIAEDGSWFVLSEDGKLSASYDHYDLSSQPVINPLGKSTHTASDQANLSTYPHGGPQLGVPNKPGHLILY